MSYKVACPGSCKISGCGYSSDIFFTHKEILEIMIPLGNLRDDSRYLYYDYTLVILYILLATKYRDDSSHWLLRSY
jgi:hypothetical protein